MCDQRIAVLVFSLAHDFSVAPRAEMSVRIYPKHVLGKTADKQKHFQIERIHPIRTAFSVFIIISELEKVVN